MHIFSGTIQQQAGVVSANTPVVESITLTGFWSNATIHNVNMPPTVEADELILVVWGNDGAATVSATGFTIIYQASFTTHCNLALLCKIAVGNEGGTTLNFPTTATEQAAAMVYRISQWGGTLPTHVVAGTASQGTTANPDPPSLTSGFGAVSTLWIAAVAASSVALPTAIPSGYSYSPASAMYIGGGTTNASGLACSGWKLAAAASEDPGTFSFDALANSTANTFAVKGI